ncbi:MAG: hypothetical protein LAT67_08345 [Balneolales bacterium]|nr:hypothetical protein [Balneolales bacterium]
MGIYTYDDIQIDQKYSVPRPGDKVLNITNQILRINQPYGIRKTFEVKGGIITREVSEISIEHTIMAVLFVLMSILGVFLAWLWWM